MPRLEDPELTRYRFDDPDTVGAFRSPIKSEAGYIEHLLELRKTALAPRRPEQHHHVEIIGTVRRKALRDDAFDHRTEPANGDRGPYIGQSLEAILI